MIYGQKESVLTQMLNRVLGVKIAGGDYYGKTEFIPCITLLPTEDNVNFSFHLKRHQFPVCWHSQSPSTRPRANLSDVSVSIYRSQATSSHNVERAA